MICRDSRATGGGMELADATVDQDQAWQRLFLFEDAAIAAGDRFPHAGKIVVL